MTFPSFVTTATAFRSLASTQIFPIEGDVISAFEYRMGGEYLAEARRINRKRCWITSILSPQRLGAGKLTRRLIKDTYPRSRGMISARYPDSFD
jgi:hypothetical protein